MRTPQEIADYYRGQQDKDLFGFTAEAMLGFLPSELLKEFCKPDADLSDWEPDELTEDSVLETMRDYMEFAWTKARDHRGISALRSVEKMRAWLWILGDDELVSFADDRANYAQYGAPILKAICEKYDFPVPESEAIERMAKGQLCRPDCQEGCGQ